MNAIKEFKKRNPEDRVVARALCVRDGMVLGLWRHKGGEDYLVLPGGGLDLGETHKQAAVREALEETGVVVRAGEEVLTLPFDGKFSEQHIIRCEYISGEPVANEKSEEYQRMSAENSYRPAWVPIEEARLHIRPEVLVEYL